MRGDHVGPVWLSAVILLLAGPARASSPVVVELFTSQACSSCPPADALLAELGRTRSDVLPLDFHVTYWNGASWKDPFSSVQATERQQHYASLLRSDIYTPQLVVDGIRQVVGSDRGAVMVAIADAKTDATDVSISLRQGHAAGSLAVAAGAGSGQGELLLIGYDDSHVTHVGGGENGGRVLNEINVVRSVTDLAHWDGGSMELQVPVPAGEHSALLLQAPGGRILAAAKSDPQGQP